MKCLRLFWDGLSRKLSSELTCVMQTVKDVRKFEYNFLFCFIFWAKDTELGIYLGMKMCSFSTLVYMASRVIIT